MLEKKERQITSLSAPADLSNIVQPTTLNVIGASIQTAFFGTGTLFADLEAAAAKEREKTGTPMSKEDFDNVYGRQYKNLKWTEGMTQEGAAILSAYEDQQRDYESVLSRASNLQSAAAFVPTFAAAMIETKNAGIELGVQAGVSAAAFAASKANPITAAYLPVKALAATHKILTGAKVSARTKFAYGAGLGVVSAGIAEPSNISSAETLQQDYDYVDTLMNIASSSMLGGTIEAAPTWVRSLRQKFGSKAFDVHAAKMDTAAAQMAEGQPIDLSYPEAAAKISMADVRAPVNEKINAIQNFVAEKTGKDIFPSQPDLKQNPDIFLEQIDGLPGKESQGGQIATLHHGTNINFTKLDPAKSGGMVFFGEDQFIAKRYAEGSGGNRARLSDLEKYIVGDNGIVYELTGAKTVEKTMAFKGERFNYEALEGGEWSPIGRANPNEILVNKKSLLPLDRKYSSLSMDEAKAATNPETGTAELIPKSSKIITKDFENLKLLDISTPEGRDVIAKLNPTTKIGQTLVDAAKYDAKSIDNSTTQLNNNFWQFTKSSKSFGNQLAEDIVEPLKKLGYDGVRFKDDQHKSIGLFDSGLEKEVNVKNKIITDTNWARIARDNNLSPNTKKQLTNPSEYVVRNRETGETIFKTQDKTLLSNVNRDKYETVPLAEHLLNLDGKSFDLTEHSLLQAEKVRALHEQTAFTGLKSGDDVLKKIVNDNTEIINSVEQFGAKKLSLETPEPEPEYESFDDIYKQAQQFKTDHDNIMRMIEAGEIDAISAAAYKAELAGLDPDSLDNGFLELQNCLLGI
jgi:hypothetical protein